MKKTTLRAASEREKDRIEVAKIFIDRLRTKQLITKAEAESLEGLLEIIVIEKAPVSKLQHEVERLLARNPGPIAGAIATTVARAAFNSGRFVGVVRVASTGGD